MKFVDLALVAAAACLVGQVVFGQQTKEDDDMCMSPAIQLRNVARQTTLVDMEQILKEVRDAVLKTNPETQPPQPEPEPSTRSDPVSLLSRKTPLNSLYLLIIMSMSMSKNIIL